MVKFYINSIIIATINSTIIFLYLDLDTKTMTWGNGEHADFPGNWCEGEEPGVEEGPVVLKSNHYCWNEGWGVNRKEAYVCEKPATMQNTNQLSNQL